MINNFFLNLLFYSLKENLSYSFWIISMTDNNNELSTSLILKNTSNEGIAIML